MAARLIAGPETPLRRYGSRTAQDSNLIPYHRMRRAIYAGGVRTFVSEELFHCPPGAGCSGLF